MRYNANDRCIRNEISDADPYFDEVAIVSAKRWLQLGVWSLAAAGLFSILIVCARTPAFAKIPALKDFFHIALVAHVDLSVLIWFIAIAGMIFSLAGRSNIAFMNGASFGSVAAGTAMIAVSPFLGTGSAVMSNYIPVLTNSVFYLGLGLTLAGAFLISLNLLLSPYAAHFSLRHIFSARATIEQVQRFGSVSAAAILLISLLCYAWSAHGITGVTGQPYFELLFWGGGHVMQFMDTQLMMLCWVWLAGALGLRLGIRARTLAILYASGLGFALVAPVAYLLYPVDSFEHRQFFTDLMIMANGLAPAALFTVITFALLKRQSLMTGQRALMSSLVTSMVLFAYGGVLGMMISGQNVTIPAHYHGAIIGVTLSFMGLAYALLPRLGYATVAHSRTAFWQPIVYGGGQLIHISALAWSGGYGVLRKTPGALEPSMSAAKITMGIMGIGGLIAIIGGVMFVVVMLRAIYTATAFEKRSYEQ